MKTIRELAQECNVSYEAIRRSVSRYSKDLTGHITQEPGGKKLYLDEYAQTFLQERRRLHPVVAKDDRLQEKIEELEQEKQALLERMDYYRTKCEQVLTKLTDTQEQLTTAQQKLLEGLDTGKIAEITEQHEQTQKLLEVAQEQLQTTQEQLTSAQDKAKGLQTDNDRLRTENREAEEQKQSLQEQLQKVNTEADQERQALQQKIEDLQSEVNSYQPSLFGFYRRKR